MLAPGLAWAQDTPDAPPAPPAPVESPAPASVEPAPTEQAAPAPLPAAGDDEETTAGSAAPAVTPKTEAAPLALEPPATSRADDAPSASGNDDVIAMTNAGLSESTILAAISANDMRFDVSPPALIGLKSAGVSEHVIDAMLASETARKKAATQASKSTPQTAAAAAAQSAEFVRLSSMIERLATQQDAATAAQRAPEPPPSADPAPRAWILSEGDRMPLSPTIAQVALTDDKTGDRIKTLQSLAGTALVFVNPAVGGIATTIGGLFHSDNKKRTAIWALAGTAAARELRSQPVFEVEFGQIPGVDPDEYQPAIVRLVPTKDNYRLVAAAKTDRTKATAMPDGPIIEEPVVTRLQQLGRGRYRATVDGMLPAGEYALVLRPVEKDNRGRHRRRRTEGSLGDLFGGVVGQILYFTWDFAVAASSRPD